MDRPDPDELRAAALACARFEDLLAVRGGLEPAAAAELDAHLATCVACRAIANTMAPLDVAVRRSALPVVPTNLYSFGREVARGGMGRVVAAQDLRIGRPVAVKELLDTSTAARFEREARITARLQHPGIVPIYEIGAWSDGTPFYTMRMVEGRTLSAALAEAENRLALLPSVIAAAEAVAFAHAHDVIHRDLKPSNIMVGAFGETVVIDWGLAKELDADDPAPELGPYREAPASSDLTQVGEVMGTAAYMPPEQASGGVVDRHADVYTLGAILYHLLAGHPPYKGTTSLEIVEKVKTEAPPPLTNAPRDLASIVAKAMARDPADRYPSARELADELVRFQTGRVVEAHAYSRRDLVRRWLRRRRGLVIGASAALVAMVVAGAIGIAGVLRERDNANAHEAKEHAISTSLLEEQGRQELLAGHHLRALAFLDAAMQDGLDTPALRFMLARALPSIEAGLARFTCESHVHSLVVSDDGSHLVAACGDVVRAWDLGTQQQTLSVTVPGTVDAFASPDGTQIIAVGAKAVLIDATGAVRRELGHDAIAAGFTPDGARAIVTYADASVQVWELATGASVRTLGAPAASGPAARGAISADGRFAAASADSGRVAIFDVASGATVAAFEQGSQLTDLGISDDGKTIVACGTNARAMIWRADAPLRTIEAHSSSLLICALSGDGVRLHVSSKDQRDELWDTRSGRQIASSANNFIRHAAFSRGGRMFATSDSDAVRLWASDTGAPLASFDQLTMTRPGPVAFSRDGTRVFAADGSVITARSTKNSRRLSFVPPDGEITDVVADGTRALVRTRDGGLALWNTETGARVPHARLVTDPGPNVNTTWYFTGDGQRLAATNGVDAILLIDVRTGATVATVPAKPGAWPSLSTNGTRMVIVEGELQRVWDLERGVEIMRFPVELAANWLTPDGRRLLVWKSSSEVDVWDLDTNRRVSTLHPSGEFSVGGYDATGTRVILHEQPGVYQGEICALYDVATGRRMRAHAATAASSIRSTSTCSCEMASTERQRCGVSSTARPVRFRARRAPRPHRAATGPCSRRRWAATSRSRARSMAACSRASTERSLEPRSCRAAGPTPRRAYPSGSGTRCRSSPRSDTARCGISPRRRARRARFIAS